MFSEIMIYEPKSTPQICFVHYILSKVFSQIATSWSSWLVNSSSMEEIEVISHVLVSVFVCFSPKVENINKD